MFPVAKTTSLRVWSTVLGPLLLACLLQFRRTTLSLTLAFTLLGARIQLCLSFCFHVAFVDFYSPKMIWDLLGKEKAHFQLTNSNF